VKPNNAIGTSFDCRNPHKRSSVVGSICPTELVHILTFHTLIAMITLNILLLTATAAFVSCTSAKTILLLFSSGTVNLISFSKHGS
jgi:hypothetical protein